MERRQQTGRIAWIDIAKALTMLLVVFGHVMRQGLAWKIVYSFHVPAFFLLAGATCRVGSGMGKQIRRDAITILLPYFFWGLISILAFSVVGPVAMRSLSVEADASIGGGLYGLVYASPRTQHMKFNLPLWFLPSLFVTKALFYGLHAVCHRRRGLLLLGTGLTAALGFAYTYFQLPPLPYALEISCKLLPFFVLGYLLTHSGLANRLQILPRGTKIFGSALLLAGTCAIAAFAPKINYTSDTFPNIGLFYLCALGGSVGILLLAMGLGKLSWLEFVGRQTLAILVMHKFPVVLFQVLPPVKRLLQSENALSSFLAGMGVTVLSMGLCILAGRIIQRFFPMLLGRIRPSSGGSSASNPV